MALSLVEYHTDSNKPDRVVNGNNVVVSNRVAGRWRGDGQSGAKWIGDNRECDNWITADGPEMSSQQLYNKTDRQYPTLGGRQEDRTRPYFSGKSKARGGKKTHYEKRRQRERSYRKWENKRKKKGVLFPEQVKIGDTLTMRERQNYRFLHNHRANMIRIVR